ncbi:MAG: site-specific DNA-methyltransferase, partial [Acidobacteriota bacterium]|nr:site-specific DNA-methyltransferase [Acidobacteriota bacterium]
DENFGRANFVGTVIWEKRYSPQNAVKWFSESHDFIIVYAKNKLNWYPNLLERSDEMNARYRNPDNDPRGVWKPADATAQGGHGTKSQFYVLTAPNGKQHTLPNGRCWLYTEPVFKQMIADNRIWFGTDGNNVPAVKRFLSEVKQGTACQTIWKYVDVGHNQEAKKEVIKFNSTDIFATPKPERLLGRIIHLATNEGDLVLDSFAGSGTTGAVAHKMGRRWIMVELGEHIHTHIIPRLKKVIDGTDQGGISQAVRWQGGGGFRHFHLAPSLLEKDRWGNWVVNKQYNAAMLAEAMCKHEGFTYAPSDTVYWQHGHSTERDFIYVTTQTLNRDQLAALAEEVGDERTLLICCGAFRANAADFPNLTLKKIPNAVLNRCEWGRDDYSLQIASLPAAEPAPDGDAEAPPPVKAKQAKRAEAPLFEQGGEA